MHNDENHEPNVITPEFNDDANKQKEWPRHPAPQHLVNAGITTKETLDFRSRQEPEVPAPEPTPDDPDGWQTARAKALKEQARVIMEQREEFQDRSSQMRETFNHRSVPETDIER